MFGTNLSSQNFAQNFKFLRLFHEVLANEPTKPCEPFQERCRQVGLSASDPPELIASKMEIDLLPEFLREQMNPKSDTESLAKNGNDEVMRQFSSTRFDDFQKFEGVFNVNEQSQTDLPFLKSYTAQQMESRWEKMNTIIDTFNESKTIVGILTSIDKIVEKAPDSELKAKLMQILQEPPNYVLEE